MEYQSDPQSRSLYDNPDFKSLKQEVDALQVANAEKEKPWYRNLSLILSGIALLFSFGTTVVSYNRDRTNDIHNLKAELRQVLERIATLPRESIELQQRYKQDQITLLQSTSYMNQENALFSRQADELIKTIPETYVSAAEYANVAWSQVSIYNYQEALDLYGKAITVSADDLNDWMAAVRGRAQLYFALSQPEKGRVDYQTALGVFSSGVQVDEYTRRATQVQTELMWANSEAGIRNAVAAGQHIANAETYVQDMPASPGAAQLKAQIEQTKALLLVPTTLTAGRPPLAP